MEKYFKKITDHVYGFLLWDESWNSFNNCYVLVEGDEVTLIDSGKEEHFEHLSGEMKKIGIENITRFVATHGHRDHIGGVRFLENVEGYIHEKDLQLVPEELRGKFNTNLREVDNLEHVLLGHHTKGSVALYHKKDKVLFCGDHICFFGEPINGQVVEDGDVTGEKFKKFVSEWSQNEEMRKKRDFDSFIKGLKAMNQFEIEYLCTGHGVVLKGGINRYISELITFE
ncbi:MBL fold metallo-hydrolase [Robertmurraya kyonggiensis]|uniref:MBL fold metallo-hydrolase n=1 Tax=Robertmurraya kyonggiensis TaxID=1037680 RepID=A0A4U1D2L0_9BACI|nr:MBL fold metallo-hydrolase [Robertmurraya kyonggiensis]TKC15316.1 MBL fold metallo-hydrolase [Robertmurraya kyonggiensis]